MTTATVNSKHKPETKITISQSQFKKYLETALQELDREFPGADNESTAYRMLVALNNASTYKNSPLFPFRATTWNLYSRACSRKRETA